MTSDKENKILAIDISDNTIEIVESGLVEGKLKIFSMNRSELKAGIVENGEIKNEAELKKEILTLTNQAEPEPMMSKQAVFSMPDSLIYSHLFEIEENTPFDLEKSADQVIPIDKSDRMLSTKKFTINNKNYYLVMASSKSLVERWRKFFATINIDLKKIEFSPIAAFYGIKHSESTGIVCLIDIGANTTSVSFFNKDGLLYFYNLYKAGASITKKIALDNKITRAKAELIKIRTDISKDTSVAAKIIKADLKEIFNDLKKNINYLQDLFGAPIEKIIVLGGTAKQAGMQDYLINLNFKIPLALPEPLHIDNEKLEYINAVGLSVLGNNINQRAEQRLSIINNKKQKSSRQIDLVNKYKRSIILFLILMLVVFFGILLNANKIPEKELDLFTQEYPYTINLPVIIEIDPVKENAFRARTVKIKIENPTSIAKLLDQGKKIAAAELEAGEILWVDPLNDLSGDNLVFPIYLEWLIYNQYKARASVLDEVARLMNETTYVFEEMKIQSLVKEEENGYKIYALAKVHSTMSLDELNAKKEILKEAEANKKQMIKVKDIGTNLNVRQGPGTTYAVVGQALSLGLYEFIKEENGWYQINLNKNTTGWVLGDFVEKEK
jgi:Tfp pilus assembly PilM family ATPase